LQIRYFVGSNPTGASEIVKAHGSKPVGFFVGILRQMIDWSSSQEPQPEPDSHPVGWMISFRSQSPESRIPQLKDSDIIQVGLVRKAVRFAL
jgi:hypothetical protein